MFPALIAAAVAALVALPAPAHGHALVRVNGSEIVFEAPDAVSLNTLTVRPAGSEIELRDARVEGGLDPGPCRPGEVDSRGTLIQVFCPAEGVDRIRADLGEREDIAAISVALPTVLSGGNGADRLSGGYGADVIAGDSGNDEVEAGWGADVVDPGLGQDTVAGGDGDDELRVRDGERDTVSCGAGTDLVVVDALDSVELDCEQVERLPDPATPAPPEGGGPPVATPPPAPDRVAPKVRTRVRREQRVARLQLVASSSEPGTVAVSGYLVARGLALPITVQRGRVQRAGVGVRLTIKLSARARREAARAWRRGRRVVVRLSVVGTDAAGNSARIEAPSIRLLR